MTEHYTINYLISRARFVYVGDGSGQITVLKLDSSGVQFINVLKGQGGTIQCLSWDGQIGWLFSGEEEDLDLRFAFLRAHRRVFPYYYVNLRCQPVEERG